MDAATANAFEAAYRELREAFAAPVQFGTVTVSAIVRAPVVSRDLVAGGFGDEGESSVHVLIAELPALPALGSRAFYDGRSYTVFSLKTRPGHPVAEIGIRPANK
jgi:hypothetical protein